MMHPTPILIGHLWLGIARVLKDCWQRPLVPAGLLVPTFLLLWQVTTLAGVQAADASAVDGPWRFVDESKPGAPIAMGAWAQTTAEAPTEIAARFTLSSTMQALALQYDDAELAGLPLAQIEELSYCTRLVDGPRPYAVMLELNVDADVTDGDKSWQGRLVYTPSYNGAVIQGDWQCWDTLVGKWWATGGPVAAQATVDNPQPLGTLLAHFPNLGIHSDYSVVLLKAGDGWSYFQGEASPVVLGVEGEQSRLAFGTVTDANAVLLPVVYQEPEQAPQAPDANDGDKKNGDKEKDKQEKDEKEKKDRWRTFELGDFNWDDFDWENFDWDKVDWEHLDWSAFGIDIGNSERAEALRAFIADVKQCKDGGWEAMNFQSPGACVAYYVEQHTPGDWQWGDNWYDPNWFDRYDNKNSDNDDGDDNKWDNNRDHDNNNRRRGRGDDN